MSPSEERTRGGRLRRRLGWGAAVLLLAALLWTRYADPFGDRGLANVFTALWLLLLAGLGLVALLLTRVRTWRGRGAVLLALGAALGGLFALVRIEGVSGEMVPELAWRFAAPSTPRVPTPPEPSPGTAPVLGAPTAEDYSSFLGPHRDAAVADARLADDWEARPPRERWRQPIGAGWSAFAVAGGLAVTMEQDASGQRVSARATTSGALLWSTAVDEPFEHSLGGDGPRATPTLELAGDGGRVWAQSAWGVLVCLDAASGRELWRHDLARERGLTRARESELAQYGRSSSPLVTESLVIVPGGGEPGPEQAGLVAFDKTTGAPRWAGPPRMYSYASPARATLAGRPQILIVNEASLSGHDPEDGGLLWEHDWPGHTSGDANASQAVPIPPDRVFVSKGYGGGGLLLALATDENGRLATRELWHEPRLLRTKLTNVVRHGDFLYGLDDGMLECVELASGTKRWKEGRYGHGQILLAGDRLLVTSEEGEVWLVEASPERANAVRGRFSALEGKCWANPALADGVLYLRNAETCVAFELPRD